MKTTTKTTVVISKQELIDLVKKTLPYNIQDNEIEVIVEPNKEDAIEWIEIPEDWYSNRCPNKEHNDKMVQVMFSNNRTDKDFAYVWNWKQEGSLGDIVKYRIID